MFTYDIAIIGSGPGGYVSAIRAAQLGLKICVIEKAELGGICLNWGCIPSKSLIHQAKAFSKISTLENMGVQINSDNLNYENIHNKSRQVAERLSKGVSFLLNKNKVDVITGKATIKDKNTILINNKEEITTKNILIASGSSPREIKGFEFDGKMILSSKDILTLKNLPKSIIIIGAGAIGLEFAYILNSFGVEVQIVEMLDNLLPASDKEVTNVISRLFRRKKIKAHLETKALSLSKKNNMVNLTIEKKGKQEVLTAEKMLVAVGRKSNIENLNLEKVGINILKGFIEIQDYYKTNIDNIYAIGDVINSPQLAHVASKEGEIAVEHIAGKNPEKKINENEIPYGVYCEPQIAGFGITEETALKSNINFQKSVFPYRAIGKAVAIDETDGLVKIIYDSENKNILGAHIAGADATELIHQLLLAKKNNISLEKIAEMIHAHPTLSESIMEASKMAGDGAIHI